MWCPVTKRSASEPASALAQPNETGFGEFGGDLDIDHGQFGSPASIETSLSPIGEIDVGTDFLDCPIRRLADGRVDGALERTIANGVDPRSNLGPYRLR